MAHEIHKVRVREALGPRPEPYWGPPLARGRVVGFRKIDAHMGSWVARMRNETGHKKYKALGYVSAVLDYEKARAAATTWFEGQDAGVLNAETTVQKACAA